MGGLSEGVDEVRGAYLLLAWGWAGQGGDEYLG